MKQACRNSNLNIYSIFEELYKQRPISVQPLDHDVNMKVFVAKFEGTLEDRVIKLSNDEQWKKELVLDEQKIMSALRRNNLPEVPEVEFCQNDSSYKELPFFTMRYVKPGVNVDFLINADVENAEYIWKKTGLLRAKFSQVDWTKIPNVKTPQQAAEQLLQVSNDVEEALDEISGFNNVFADLINAARELAISSDCGLGQYDRSDILTCDINGLAMIDFSGFVGAQHRLREIGITNGWIKWVFQDDSRIPKWQEQGFFDGEAITKEVREILNIHEIYSLISNIIWQNDLALYERRNSQLEFALKRLNDEMPV